VCFTFTAIGVAEAGRLSPGTWTSFGAVGAGKSGGAGPALNAAGAWPWWLCAMTTPTQIPASAISARMSCRSRISPLTGITRLVSAWIAHVFN
jgi:hypothetical protein